MDTFTTYNWAEIGTIDHNAGDVGGDLQAGPAHSRQFFLKREDDLYSVVTGYAFADFNETTGAWDVCEMTEFIVCSDLEDIGGTEVDSNYTYEYPLYLAVGNGEEANRAAEKCAEGMSAFIYEYWNGHLFQS